MTTQARAQILTSLNLNTIFGEKHTPTRLKNIEDLWVPSGEALFVDPAGVFKTHDEMSGMIDGILGGAEAEDKFIELSEVECLKHDDETDTWVTRVQWGVGSSTETVKLKGWDILTIVRGKIKACYTFLDK